MTPRALRLFPLAYHVSLQAYGQWVPGDPRGWHRRGDGAFAPPRPGHVVLQAMSRELQRQPTATITDALRGPVVDAIAAIALGRAWTVHAVATAPSHLHVVVTADVMGVALLRVIREESVAALARRGLVEPTRRLWSAGGYFTMVHTVRELERACGYVERQRVGRDDERDGG